MSWFHFLLGCLATFRLSLLISKEDGPAWIFRKLRHAPPHKSSARQGLSCPWCVSVWMAALVTLFFWWRGNVAPRDFGLYLLAFSAGAIVLNQAFTRDDK